MNHRIALLTVDLSLEDERMYHFMAKALSEAGWRVEIINTVFEGRDSDKIYYRKVDVPFSKLMRNVFAYKAMINGLLKSRADIAVIFDAELLKILPKVKHIMPIQVIFDANKHVENNKIILKRKLIYADAIVSASEEKADTIMKLIERSCTVIRDSCDADMLISLCDELEKGGRYNI